MSAQMINNLLTPDNCAVILIDHQPQMFFSVQSIDRQTIVNNAISLAKVAKDFNVPTILTTVDEQSFNGVLLPEIQAVFPEQKPIDRITMNAWKDENVVSAVKKIGRKKLVMASFLTETCLVLPAICAAEEGYEVYAVVDASGGTTAEAHEAAIQRMIHAGVALVTCQQILLEFQCNWTSQKYKTIFGISKAHTGKESFSLKRKACMKVGQPDSAVA